MTTAKQTILPDGRRLVGENGLNITANDVNALSIDLSNADRGAATGINADTLGGIAAGDYVLKTDTIENAVNSVNAETAADSNLLGGKAPIYYIQPRNLLDNSDFTNPVNQREWTGGNGVYKYTIDRWTIGHSANESHLEIVEGVGVKISPVSDTYVDFNQNLEHYSKMKGKTYTFACKDSDGNTYVKSFSMGCGGTGSIGNFELFSTDDRNVIIRYYGTLTLTWAALYEGAYTVDTLPPYIPKGYGIELAECLRYFRKFGNQKSNATMHIGMGMAATTTVANVVLELGIPLRSSSPSISYTGTVYLRYGTTDVEVSALSMNYQSCGQTYFAVTSSSLTAGRVYALRLYNGACIDISADL